MNLFGEGEPDVVELVLPWPPSLNHYYVETWSEKYNRILKFPSKDGKNYQSAVHAIILGEGKNAGLKGNLRFEAEFFPPNNMRRDLDNLLKVILDSLKNRDEGKAGQGIRLGVYGDDSQIKEMYLRFGPTVRDGRVRVKISTLGM